MLGPAMVWALVCASSAPVILSATGCGGGAHFDGARYRREEVSFQVGAIGADWRTLRVSGSQDLAWVLPGGGAVHAAGSCDPGLDIPLESLTAHLLIGFTEREIRVQERFPMDGREAMRTHVLAKLDGVERELLLVILKKDGCVYDLGLLTAPGAGFERARPAFEAFVAAFRGGS